MSSARVGPPAVPARRWARVFLALTAVGAFIALTIAALYRPAGQAVDQFTFEVIASHTRVGALAQWFEVERHALVVLIVGTLLAMAVAAARHRFALAARVGVLVVGANVSTQILKNWLLRRPYLGVGYDLPNSFPSGHATALLSLAFALTIVTAQRFRALTATVLAVVAAIGSLVIVASGWHRPSDLLGALAVVMVWALVLCPQEVPQRGHDVWGTLTLAVSAAALVVVGALAWAAAGAMSQVVKATLGGATYSQLAGAHPTLVTATSVVVPVSLVAVYLLCLQTVAALQSGRRGRS